MENDEPQRVDSLHLTIYHCICDRCQNSWTHSHTLLASQNFGYLGGTPSKPHFDTLPFKSYERLVKHQNGCFKCVVEQLGTNWEFTQPPWRKGTTSDPIPEPTLQSRAFAKSLKQAEIRRSLLE